MPSSWSALSASEHPCSRMDMASGPLRYVMLRRPSYPLIGDIPREGRIRQPVAGLAAIPGRCGVIWKISSGNPVASTRISSPRILRKNDRRRSVSIAGLQPHSIGAGRSFSRLAARGVPLVCPMGNDLLSRLDVTVAEEPSRYLLFLIRLDRFRVLRCLLALAPLGELGVQRRYGALGGGGQQVTIDGVSGVDVLMPEEVG